jgi:hypothetical protein
MPIFLFVFDPTSKQKIKNKTKETWLSEMKTRTNSSYTIAQAADTNSGTV